jgi:CRP-like cAMP-binding protein
MDTTQFKELSDKLDVVIKLLAANTVAGKTFTEQVEYLASVGMSGAQIASTLGKPINSVTGITARLRKQGTKK